MHRLLIIDDDAAINRLLERLCRKAGFDCVTATTGEAGLAALGTDDAGRDRPVDAVICDLGLPGLSGVQVVETIRAEERTARLPVVVISARTSMQDHALALEAGADHFLEKPLDHKRLLQVLRELLPP